MTTDLIKRLTEAGEGEMDSVNRENLARWGERIVNESQYAVIPQFTLAGSDLMMFRSLVSEFRAQQAKPVVDDAMVMRAAVPMYRLHGDPLKTAWEKLSDAEKQYTYGKAKIVLTAALSTGE